MASHSNFTRRAVLAMLAAAGLITPAAALTPMTSRTASVLRSLLDTQHASAAHLGRAYLAMAPAEAETDKLIHALDIGIPDLAAMTERGDQSVVRSALAGRITRDFGEGLTTVLDGWVISRTEARLCALHALDGPPNAVLSS